jgi:hypothetical protein
MNTLSADELISEIAQGRRKVAPGDGGVVRAHIAKAAFNREARLEKDWSAVGDTVVGCPHPTQHGVTISEKTSLTSLERHLAKRIRDEQWLPPPPRPPNTRPIASELRPSHQSSRQVFACPAGRHANPRESGLISPA